MHSSVLKHITEEKDISRYKISLLNKGVKKKYKARLISIEQDFIDYAFEKIKADSVEELRAAMSLFRTDRHLFYKKYEKKQKENNRTITSAHIQILRDKLEFYSLRYKDLLDVDIQEINLVQDEYIRSLSGISSEELSSHGMDSILELEGASLSKARARIQVLTYCLARFMHDRVRELEARLSSTLSPEEFDQINKSLNNIFSGMPRMLFKHYNEGISQVPLLINGTLGHNNFILATYPLSNILDKYPGEYNIKRLLRKDRNFFGKSGAYIKKRFVDRGFGLPTSIRRVGSESIDLLYLDLWSSGGIRLSNVFESSFFNYNDGKEYYKAISMMPIWRWPSLIDNPYMERELGHLLGLSSPLGGQIDLDNKDVLESVNCSGENFISIDISASKIMVAATRSEASHLEEAKKYISVLASSIIEEFETTFGVG